MKLAVLAIFRNESHALNEWIQHYIGEGVDHFYLINNASEDNYQPILDQYKDIITLRHEPRVFNQDVMNHKTEVQFFNYNKTMKPIIDKDKVDWVIVCDIDEFIYARRGYKTIREFIEDKGSSFDQILIRQKTFTSNGLYDQPMSLVQGFTERLDYSKEHKCVPKTIVKASSLYLYHIHYAVLKPESSITAEDNLKKITNGIIAENKKILIPIRNKLIEYIDEQILDDAYLACNHYHTQSEEWFFRIKATRGVAASGHDHGESMKEKWPKLWKEYLRKPKIHDTELKDRKGL